MADTLPSLFRWEPGMMAICGDDEPRLVLGVRPDGGLALDVGCGSVLRLRAPAECRPGMSHAGTRGLVLEQVRVALKDPGLHPRMVFDPTVERWRWRINWNDMLDTEGDAIMDALRRAEVPHE